jgi:ABC-type uncharacterized transport system permease subunit
MESLFKTAAVLLPVAYGFTLWVYGRLFFTEDEARYDAKAKVSFGLTFGAHTVLLLALGGYYHRCPLGNQGEALLFMGWMLAFIHLLSESTAETRRMGFFTLGPITVCAAAAAVFGNSPFVGLEGRPSSWFIFHIVAALVSYAGYCLAAVLASLYLLLHSRLKQKKFDLTFRKLPPLDKLDKLSAMWAALGSLTMLASSLIGFLYVRHAQLEGMQPREFAIYAVLLVFGFTAASRRLWGWRGRRHAQWVIFGFALLLLTNLLGTHGFKL